MLGIVLGWGLLAPAAGCSKKETYSQATPEDVVKSAIAMAKNGQASQMSRLFFADSTELRAVLNRLGGLLGSMQSLAEAVQARFPEDLAKLRAEASKSDAADRGAKVLSAFSGGRTPGTERERRDLLENTMQALLADPFGWLEANAPRLTAVTIADDTAALMLDGQPIPPVGLTMRRSGDEWFIVLPLNLPVVSQYVPQTEQEWKILASLVKVLDNAVKDLADDVRAGKVKKLENLAEKAGEKAFGPAAMVFVVYGKEMDVRTKREKAVADLRKRLAKWTDERTKAGQDLQVLQRASDLVLKAAVEPLDQAVRKDTALIASERKSDPQTPKFEKMPSADLEALGAQWLSLRGAKLDLSGEFDAPAVDAAAKALADSKIKAKPKSGK